MINDDKLIEKLKKLQALAERGVGGEKDTAQKKLDKLLASSGLTLESLNNEIPQYYLFSYQNKFKQRLLVQVIYKVLGAAESISFYKSKNTRNKIGIYCTPAQKLEIELDFEFYSEILDDEFEIFMTAFIQKQNLYPSDGPTDVVSLEGMTDEEKAEWAKIAQYEQGIDRHTRYEMIESK